MQTLALLLCLLAAPAFAAEPPKAANCPATQAAPVVIVVLAQTLGERIIERRMARLADQYARQQERASRVVFLRVGVFAGCR